MRLSPTSATRSTPAQPLTLEDGVALYHHPNLMEVGALANEVRERLHGDRTYFNRNFHINATNVCVASCMFCSFARLKEGDPDACTMTHDEAWGRLQKRVDAGEQVTEIHIVNGLHDGLPFDYYTELLRGLKRIKPSIHLKAFTAVELFYYHQHYGMTVAAGDRAAARSGPGFAARAAAPRSSPTAVRRKICDDKATGDAMAGRAPHRPPDGPALQLHHAVRHHRDPGRAGRPHVAAARAAGRDRRLSDLHPAGLPPREQLA